MEAGHLIPVDLEQLTPLDIVDDASVSLAREQVRTACATTRLPDTACERLVAVASELTRNQLVHAGGGRFFVRRVERAGVLGVEIIAAYRGEGIEKPTRALEGSSAKRAGLGVGLGSALRLSDEMDFDVREGEGTTIFARNFAGPVPFRSEVAILGRACAGEAISGDDAMFLRVGDGWILSVVDGLGHGVQARRASSRAVATLREQTSFADMEDVFDQCHRALKGTRGAVMSVARFERNAGELDCVCVGDVGMQIVAFRESRRLSCKGGYIGTADSNYRVKTERLSVRAGELVLAYSDGLKTGTDISQEAALLREHPLIIADHLLTHYGRSSDDVMIIVVR